MFIKFWSSESGKILKGTIISYLIFTLTFANILFLVPYILESYAIDAQPNMEENEIIEEVKSETMQKLITNKTYSFGEQEKRILQVELETRLMNSEQLIKTNVIEVQVPELEELNLEQTTVIVENELLQDEKENSQASWKYNQETKTININIENLENEEGKITNLKTTEKFIVTYVYDNNAVAKNINTKAISKITLENNSEVITSENVLNIENELEDFGEIITLRTTNSELYKGNMYLEKQTEYSVCDTIFVTYLNLTDKMVLNISNGEFENIKVEDTFTKTSFRKEQLENILGMEGVITIYDEKNMETPLRVIKIADELSKKDDSLIVEFEEGVTNIVIETTKPIKEGKIDVLNFKTINLQKGTLEDNIKSLTEIKTKYKLSTNDIILENTNIISLLEPKTNFETSVENENLVAKSDETLRLKTILRTDSPECKLFKNPIIEIELPKEVENVKIENISLLFDDELEIEEYSLIEKESGNKSVRITLKGEQTKYNTVELQKGSTIVIDLKVGIDELTPNRNVEVKTTCINDGEEVLKIKSINIVNIIGLLNKTTLIENEANTANYLSKFVNNYLDNMENVEIIGELPSTANICSEVQVNLENTQILYTEDLEEWKSEREASSQIKAFKIKAKENIEQETEIDLQTAFQGIGEIKLTVTGVVNEKNVQKTFTIKLDHISLGEFANIEKSNGVVLSIEPQTTSGVFHVGEMITYKILALNNGETEIKEATLEYEIPEGAVYTEFEYAQGEDVKYRDDEVLETKTWEIERISPGEKISKEVTVKLQKEGTLNNKVRLKHKGELLLDTSIEQEISPAKLNIKISTATNTDISLTNKDILQYLFIVENVSNEDLSNVELSIKVPENTVYQPNTEINWVYNKEKNEYTYTLEKLLGGEKTIIESFDVKVETNNKVANADIINSAIARIADKEEYVSNTIKNTISSSILEIHQTIENKETITPKTELKYIITVKNSGAQESVLIKDTIPEELQARMVTYYVNEQEESEQILTNNNVEIVETIGTNETLTIKIECMPYAIDENIEKVCVKNVASIIIAQEYINSETVEITIINDRFASIPDGKINPEEGEPQKPEDDSDEAEEPQEQREELYSISGLAWLDENENGIRENDEKVLTGIKVYLLDKEGKLILKDDKPIYTLTSVTGTYKFNDLKQAEYMLAFEYDAEKYSVTKYQEKTAEANTNSDAISKNVEFEGNIMMLALTDNITVSNSSVENIDIGLVNATKFDLRLDKYISKLVVTNKGGTTTYEYKNTDFAKTEVKAKYLEGTSLVIEYEINITNEGNIEGYVADVIDYISEEFTFNSELNEDWYLGTDGFLHSVSLTQEPIKLGETKTLKLVLTKVLEANETGTIVNTAEIGKSSNIKATEEIDSVAGNRKDEEDDISKASLLVSISTGGPGLYIGIVILCMILLRTKCIHHI